MFYCDLNKDDEKGIAGECDAFEEEINNEKAKS